MTDFDSTTENTSQNRLSGSSLEISREEAQDVREVPQSERSPIQLYLQEIGKTPLLSIQEEVALARKIQKGDVEARNHMIQANLRLVVKIASDYSNFGLPLMDLISEGNIGLVKAVERFDPDKGGKLSTYAAWWIKQSIKRALANQGKTIRLPVHLVDKIAKMRKITTALAEELDREPTDEEIAYQMGIPTHKVAHLRSVSVRPASLDAPVGNEEDTKFGELVSDEKATTPFQDLHTKSLSSDVAQVLHRLDEREAKIIRLRFGLDTDRALTLEEVGQEFNITRERVRQLQEIAIQKMRRAMSGRDRQRTKEEIHEETLERKKIEVLNEFFRSQSS
ncbi:MAG: sigma-70 family RNA polymerase sigma factor [Opitutales bacterium]